MTDRLYYQDSYLRAFEASVIDASPDGLRVYLDRTAFYPESGGQPWDLGVLGGVPVVEVIDEEHRIAHIIGAPIFQSTVSAQIDWARRFDHMQQHTGQHLLSAVFEEVANAPTISFHLGTESSTIDLDVLSLDTAQIQKVEQRANEIVFQNRAVHVSFEGASEATGLRKPSSREGVLRIVSIEDLDRSACGGTHVRTTAEIGPIFIRKLDKIRNTIRVEFLCGGRAVRRARADFDTLSQIARAFSAQLDETPALVNAQMDRAQEADKARRKLANELATLRGRELYATTQPDEQETRRVIRRAESIGEEVRAEVQSFTSGSRAIMLVLATNPPSVLLGASKDSGLNAGQWLKTVLSELGTRGGGSPTMAQGSLPSLDALDLIEQRLAGESCKNVS
jgi:alanyl-tRNA synthetase